MANSACDETAAYECTLSSGIAGLLPVTKCAKAACYATALAQRAVLAPVAQLQDTLYENAAEGSYLIYRSELLREVLNRRYDSRRPRAAEGALPPRELNTRAAEPPARLRSRLPN